MGCTMAAACGACAWLGARAVRRFSNTENNGNNGTTGRGNGRQNCKTRRQLARQGQTTTTNTTTNTKTNTRVPPHVARRMAMAIGRRRAKNTRSCHSTTLKPLAHAVAACLPPGSPCAADGRSDTWFERRERRTFLRARYRGIARRGRMQRR
uniref:Putative secreted protein n=1 Tax=Anopheles darlingi TaxID=43151 RepID=A0A2M4D1X8_ANODA